jgi:2-polyprenyl-3-methyl-5-hydroxy-6-metoxy-1,4-benzoquinol methylase
MGELINQSTILKYLKTKSANLSFIDKLKVVYRPLICPFDALLNYIEKEDSVFDIGCGSGQFCALVAQFTTANEIYGIEISETLVENARIVNQEFNDKKNIQFETFNGCQIPSLIQNYSKIYLIDVLHHVPKENQLEFLKEIHSKMSFGSRLILKDIDASSLLVYCNKIHDLVFSREIGNEMKANFAKKAVEEIGFKILDCYTKRMFVYPHYFLILEK